MLCKSWILFQHKHIKVFVILGCMYYYIIYEYYYLTFISRHWVWFYNKEHYGEHGSWLVCLLACDRFSLRCSGWSWLVGLGHPSPSAFQVHEVTGVCCTWFAIEHPCTNLSLHKWVHLPYRFLLHSLFLYIFDWCHNDFFLV